MSSAEVPAERSALEGEVVEHKRLAPRHPVVPAWIKDERSRRAAARQAAARAAYVTTFHGLRMPKYLTRFIVRSPLGLGRVLALIVEWVVQPEASQLISHAVEQRDKSQWRQLTRERNRSFKARLIALAVFAAAGLAGTLIADAVLWRWSWLAVVSLIVLFLGWAGRPRHRPMLDHVSKHEGPPDLSNSVVLDALSRLPMPGIREAMRAEAKGGPPAFTWLHGCHRDGPGWRCDVALPPGVVATDVIEKRDALASALRRPLGAVWPEPAHDEHPGMLTLWVGYKPMSKMAQPAWPLLKTGSFSIFDPVPFMTDQRGRPVSVPLMYSNLLIGGVPGTGKTFAMREAALAAALDPICELRIFDHKGGGDYSSFEQVAHRYVCGLSDDDIIADYYSLADLLRECEVRGAIIAKLPSSVVPERKVTPELAKRDPRLRPVLQVISECHELFSHPEHGPGAADIAQRLIRRGRAFGIILALDTQRFDADSVPKPISSNAGVRFCLRVMGQPENDMILGTSMYRAGYRATTLMPADYGMGLLAGVLPYPTLGRTYYVDVPESERICRRARAAREAAGTLGGHAAGHEIDLPSRDVLADVLVAFGDDERLHWGTLAGRLSLQLPERWAEASADSVSAQCRALGVPSSQVKADGVNRNGCYRRDVERLGRGA